MRLFDGPQRFSIQRFPRVHGEEIFEAGADKILELLLYVGGLNNCYPEKATWLSTVFPGLERLSREGYVGRGNDGVDRASAHDRSEAMKQTWTTLTVFTIQTINK